MAWLRDPFVKAVVELNSPLPAFIVPLNEPERNPMDFPFPADIWRNGGRTKAAFGSKGIELSMHQAKLRKLVKHSALFQGYVRACPDNPRAEDKLLAAHEKKQARKAASNKRTTQCV